MDRKLVIIPTYNEKENIADIIAAVFALPGNFHVLIIDDNSPDGTARIAKELQKQEADSPSAASEEQRLHLLERSGKLGLGTAYLTGFQWALEHGYDYVFEMDADFSHNPQDLLRLYRACEKGGADVAVGSRYCNGVSVVDWPISRILMSYFASAYVRGVLRMHVYDTTAGFVCYTRQVLETMDLNAVKMKGYGFQIEMKYTAWKLGFTIEEVPIIFTNRQKGTSKMSGGIFGEAFWGVIALRFRKITEAQQADQVPSSREGI
ncbi:MAG: polyprenol monophosphomannose synthase [Bacteroidales bacterium]|nr:polyprenol monophosphomannose synthase [Bacteroidales bacterium]